MTFPGFPKRVQFTAIPKGFFTALLPDMDDPVEIKALLFTFWALSQKKGYPRLVSLQELLGCAPVARAFGGGPAPAAQMLHEGLSKAVDRGVLLHVAVRQADRREEVYLLNTEEARRALQKVENGEIDLSGYVAEEAPVPTPEQSNIFSLYERNIGILTPMIVEELKEAEQAYPPQWIEDAFQEAVAQNVRKWRYVARILERWATEGRDDEGHRRGAAKDADPYRYSKGRFGHLIKH